jgi:hypothetical protein
LPKWRVAAELIKSAFKSAFGITAEKVSDVFKQYSDFDPYMQECYSVIDM